MIDRELLLSVKRRELARMFPHIPAERLQAERALELKRRNRRTFRQCENDPLDSRVEDNRRLRDAEHGSRKLLEAILRMSA